MSRLSDLISPHQEPQLQWGSCERWGRCVGAGLPHWHPFPHLHSHHTASDTSHQAPTPTRRHWWSIKCSCITNHRLLKQLFLNNELVIYSLCYSHQAKRLHPCDKQILRSYQIRWLTVQSHSFKTGQTTYGVMQLSIMVTCFRLFSIAEHFKILWYDT